MRHVMTILMFGAVLGSVSPPGKSEGPPAPLRTFPGNTPGSVGRLLERSQSDHHHVEAPVATVELAGELPAGPRLIPANTSDTAGSLWSETATPVSERMRLPLRLADHHFLHPEVPLTSQAVWTEDSANQGDGLSIQLSFDIVSGFGLSVASAEAAPCPLESCCQGEGPLWLQTLLTCLGQKQDCRQQCPVLPTAATAGACKCAENCKCGESCCCKEGNRCSANCTCASTVANCKCSPACKCDTKCGCSAAKRCSASCKCGGTTSIGCRSATICIDRSGNAIACCECVPCASACTALTGRCAPGATVCEVVAASPPLGGYCVVATADGNYFGQLEQCTSAWVVVRDPSTQTVQWIPTMALRSLTVLPKAPAISPDDDADATSDELVSYPQPIPPTIVPRTLPGEPCDRLPCPTAPAVETREASAYVRTTGTFATGEDGVGGTIAPVQRIIAIPKGLRLYNCELPSLVLTHVSAGDRVDLLLVSPGHPGANAPSPISRVFAENVTIADIAYEESYGVPEVARVSLLLSKEQCELAALATMVGGITICKRGPDENSPTGSPSSAEETQATNLKKLFGTSCDEHPMRSMPVLGIAPWGPIPAGPNGFSPPTMAYPFGPGAMPGVPGMGGGECVGPDCPLTVRGMGPYPQGPFYEAPRVPYLAFPGEASVPAPHLTAEPPQWPSPTGSSVPSRGPSTVPAATWPNPSHAPSTYSGLPVQDSSSPKPGIPFQPVDVPATLPNPPGDLPSPPSIPPSTMPTHSKPAANQVPAEPSRKSASLPAPPSSQSPFACQISAELVAADGQIRFAPEWKELTADRKAAPAQAGGHVAHAMNGGRAAAPARAEQLASFTTDQETDAPAKLPTLYRLESRVDVIDSQGRVKTLSTPILTTFDEAQIQVGDLTFFLRLNPAGDSNIQIAVREPGGSFHVAKLREGETLSLPWANPGESHQGQFQVRVLQEAVASSLVRQAGASRAVAETKPSAASTTGTTPAVSRAVATEDFDVRVYSVADLIEQRPSASPLLAKSLYAKGVLPEPAPPLGENLNELIQKIRAVAPQSWTANGGSASMEYSATQRALIICQVPANHVRIAELLKDLRSRGGLARDTDSKGEEISQDDEAHASSTPLSSRRLK